MYVQLEAMENCNGTPGGDSESANIKVRTPKRVLHFSDGVMEEYSDDEVDADPPTEQGPVVDPKTLSWGPWFGYKAWAAGSSALAVCDYLGEGLASIFGITTPKYWFEIEEYKRLEEEKKRKLAEAEGWSEPVSKREISLDTIKTDQPVSAV